MIKTLVKRAVDSWLPGVGLTLRNYRESLPAGKAWETPFGFVLAGSQQMASGVFERQEVECFLRCLQAVAVCIDVGANVGLYSCLAASRGKRVIAVEPLASNLKVLVDNLHRNGFAEAEVYPVGLAGSPGVARMYGGGTAASFLPEWAGTPEYWNRVVPLSTLDVLTSHRFEGLPLLIKVDVEGFEFEMLKGAERTLVRNPKPTWMVEICLNEHFPSGFNERFIETFEIFWRHGYECRVAAAHTRTVTLSDVNRWAAQGCVDFGTHNYLFVPGEEQA
jgi:FkbM family methyltransferase